MADDWIKMRHALGTDPRVLGMARVLRVPVQHVVGCLHAAWSLADQHAVERRRPPGRGRGRPSFVPDDADGVEGFLSQYSPDDLDAQCAQNGLAEAMRMACWLVVYADGLGFPDWDKHHSKSAKKRSWDAKRKRRLRENVSEKRGTKSGPEKSREEKKTKNTPLTPQGGQDGVRPRRRRAARQAALEYDPAAHPARPIPPTTVSDD